MADASIRNDQVQPGTSVFTDSKGQTGAAIDAGSLSYSVDNPALASVSQPDPQNPSDPNGFVLTPVGPAGTVVVSMRATSNGGANALSDSKSVDITPGSAVSGAITLGAAR